MAEKISLFCLPYAGGSAIFYNKWRAYLDARIELVPVELAGRGRRVHEPLYDDLQDAVQDVLKLIRKSVEAGPYIIFGHSLGSLICYELAQALRDGGFRPPGHLFFSGHSAPHVKREDEKKYHLMGEEEFRKEVLELGGTPPEFFEHPELLDFFLPVLRNDFRLAACGIQDEVIRPFDVPITIFLGKDDDQTPAQCTGWKQYSSRLCTMHYFEGGHFFIHQEARRIATIINHTLNLPEYAARQPFSAI